MNPGVLSVLVLVVVATAASAQVYKWVDDKGRVHYGEKPPEGVKANEVGVAKTPSTAPAESAQTWKDKEADFRRRQIEREQKEGAAEANRARDAENRRRQCLRARDNMDTYTSGVPVYHVNEKGERVYLEDSQRGEKIAETKRRIEQYCSP